MEKEKNKKTKTFLSIKTSIILSYIVSICSNITLFMIFYLVEHKYKFFGLFLHLLMIIISVVFVFIFKFDKKNKKLKFYRSFMRYFSIIVNFAYIFYLALLIYMYIYKYDIDIYYFFSVCVILWSIFHLILITKVNAVTLILFKNKGELKKMASGEFDEISLEERN